MRLHVPFGGFSWGLLGYPAGEYEWTRGATQFIGTTGWSVVFVAIAAGLALLVTDRRRPAGWLVPSLAVGAALVVFGAVAPPDAPMVRRCGLPSSRAIARAPTCTVSVRTS